MPALPKFRTAVSVGQNSSAETRSATVLPFWSSQSEGHLKPGGFDYEARVLDAALGVVG